jgi:hypothetical protein
MLSILEQDVNYYLNISILFPCIDCMFLKPRYASVMQVYFQGVYHIKGNFTIHVNKNEILKISES